MTDHTKAFIKESITEAIGLRLKKALQDGLLQVVYQPQIDLSTGKCVSLEALLRWHDEVLGKISPDTFIKVAEHLEFVQEITHFVIKRVAHDCSFWHEKHISINAVSINISAADIANERSVLRLVDLLKSSSIAAKEIILELTETAIIHRIDVAIESMKRLRDDGFKLALDDFGSGYSSLAYLSQFPIHEIKLDKSFLSNIVRLERSQLLTASFIKLAQALNLQTVAEGVEHRAQAQLLKDWSCTRAQGFLFSRPLNRDEVTSFLETQAFATSHRRTAPDVLTIVNDRRIPVA